MIGRLNDISQIEALSFNQNVLGPNADLNCALKKTVVRDVHVTEAVDIWIVLYKGREKGRGEDEPLSPPRFFWAQMALASLVAISGPKKVSIPTALEMDLPPSKSIRPAPYKKQVQ